MQYVDSIDSLDDYTRKYCAWTETGVEAYQSTRMYLNTLFGGGKGGSKTVTGIRIYGTDTSEYRDGVFLVIRKNYNNLKQTTQQSFERFFMPELIHSKTSNQWQTVNDNQLWFYAADITRDANYEKLRGLECSAIFVDEGSQFGEMFYEILPSLLRRPAYHIDTGEQLKPYIYITTNPVPGKNYLKRTYIDKKTRKAPDYRTGLGGDGLHKFIPSLPDNNPMLPKGYIDIAFATMSGTQLEMLRYGNWEIDDADFCILLQSQLETASNEPRNQNLFGGGIDVGLGRPDKLTLYGVNRYGDMWKHAEHEEYDTMKQVKLCLDFCKEISENGGHIYIDAGGVGKGVADRLTELVGSAIKPVMFGSSAVDERGKRTNDKYFDRRAQLYFWLREDVINANENPDTATIQIQENDDLFEEITNTFYEYDSNKLKIEKKDNIKQRIGRSPDNADALVLANVARRRIIRLGLNEDVITEASVIRPAKQFSTINLHGY